MTKDGEKNKYVAIINDYKWFTYPFIILTLSIFIYCVYVYLNLQEPDKNSINYITTIGTAISVIGSFASIVGLFIAYSQIIELKNATELTKEEVTSTLKKMQKTLIVVELSKSVQVLREIQRYLSEEKFDFAQMRMKDLKEALIQVQYNYKNHNHIDRYNELIMDFSLNLETINNHIKSARKGFKVQVIDKNMEDLASALIHFQTEIISNHGKS
jgi:uncharacterized protein with PQ loop repeat